MHRITSTSPAALAVILAAPLFVGSGNTAKYIVLVLPAAQIARV